LNNRSPAERIRRYQTTVSRQFDNAIEERERLEEKRNSEFDSPEPSADAVELGTRTPPSLREAEESMSTSQPDLIGSVILAILRAQNCETNPPVIPSVMRWKKEKIWPRSDDVIRGATGIDGPL
jgi:hypothetical protein